MKLRYPVAERKGAHTAGNVEPKAAQVTESRFYENALHFIKNYENLKKILGELQRPGNDLATTAVTSSAKSFTSFRRNTLC